MRNRLTCLFAFLALYLAHPGGGALAGPCPDCAGVNETIADPDARRPGHSDHREWIIFVPPLDAASGSPGRLKNCFAKTPPGGPTEKDKKHSSADEIWMSARSKDTIRFVTSQDCDYLVTFDDGSDAKYPFSGGVPAVGILVPANGCSKAYTLKLNLGGSGSNPKRFKLRVWQAADGRALPAAKARDKVPPKRADIQQVGPVVGADG